ncbi:MAG: MFS transporter [Lawsonibacter sp.]|nr:MFS transporter [Lawsonibacter sp.]
MVNVGPHYSVPFFAAFFLYYAGYCVFSSYVILYLTDKGYSAALCGLVTSLTLLANLAMEPFGGYLTDTFLSTRRYLAVCIGLIVGLCVFCTVFADRPALCMPALILTAGLAYPFSQLMDAWVNCSLDLDPNLVYSRVRAGGSIGFSLVSVASGYYFRRFGWDTYFLVQGTLFLLMLPLLAKLPKVCLGNSRRQGFAKTRLSLPASFRAAAGNRSYLLCLLICTVYWFSHRPVGSYLSLLVEARSGDASIFGNICGAGAAVECLGLLLLAWMQKKKPVPLWACMCGALASDVLRPLCLWLLPGIWPMYVGQATQAISFALFYSGSVECFTQTADSRIRSFSISMGLTVSSVVGTISANLLGGWLCDGWGTGSLVILSLGVSSCNCLLLFVCFPRLFSRSCAK